MSLRQSATLAESDRNLSASDREWFPKYLQQIARFQGSVSQIEPLAVDREPLIEFLKSRKAAGLPAWKRMQAARAAAWYCQHVLQSDSTEIDEICRQLRTLADKESRQEVSSVVPNDVKAGLDPDEPLLLRRMRHELRLKHYALRTEMAYVGWVERFLLRYDALKLDSASHLGARHVKAFLTDLAVQANVASSTQTQAMSALILFFRDVVGCELTSIDAVRARRPSRLPVVLSRGEVRRVMSHLGGRDLLIAQLLYGAGLRLMECLRLRVKDVRFDDQHLVIREGKGDKDRVTVLPGVAVNSLRKQIGAAKLLHESDCARGDGAVYLPHAMAQKHPNAPREFVWQYVFPAARLSIDPRSGERHRHHLHESVFPSALKRAVRKSGLQQRVTGHAFRSALA